MKLKKENKKNKSSQHTVDSNQDDVGAGFPSPESKEQEYLDGWKRALADYENLKRDLAKNREEDRNRIKIDLAYQLLPVIDNFEQALHFVPESSQEIEKWLEGVKFIKKQFEDVMASLGIEPIDTSGAFDPNFHESASEEKDESKKEGEIIKIIQSGWKMGGEIIRPAKVIVNKK